jgi:hypothetical protein
LLGGEFGVVDVEKSPVAEGAESFGEGVDVAGPASRDVVRGDLRKARGFGGDEGSHLQDRWAQDSGLHDARDADQSGSHVVSLGERHGVRFHRVEAALDPVADDG